MSAQIFSIEVLTDGGAKLALNSKHDTHSGIRRVSCEISPDELLQLVVYAEALSLRQHLGHPASSSLSVDGLELSYDPATRDLHVVRQAGYSRQTARIPVEIFQTEMAGTTEICMARAEASKHATVLAHLLAECAGPEELDKRFEQDEADLILHQLREIAFLLLVREASARGSALSRMWTMFGPRAYDAAKRRTAEKSPTRSSHVYAACTRSRKIAAWQSIPCRNAAESTVTNGQRSEAIGAW